MRNDLKSIRGILPVIPTPFTLEGEIAWEDFRALVDFAAAAGACAACLPAYASEFYKLTEEERPRLVGEAVSYSNGRLPIVGQVNTPSVASAVEAVESHQRAGVAGLAIAVPRLFALTEDDLFRYFDRVLAPAQVPVIIQDFNPGGASVSPQFIVRLHERHPQFQYIKLEEPMMAAKAARIRQETDGAVRVIEGWGGMYMLELIPAGISAVMPGVALTDLLARVFELASAGRAEEAYEIFAAVLPQIVFSLQNLELFHHAEKLLLRDRGIIRHASVRDAGLLLRPEDERHIRFLNGRILALLERHNLPANPMSIAAGNKALP
ncbi:MAG: dihydrodipicolinate synthase family protein [Bryobacteraceae bacterium]|nr:dihydrodipicolinate synthase family protein [Bryobacterales bacterium]NUN02221.1 dihydrodipicolinate synthase family protein [Bryobacteraceae bacterium]